jgi:hypothetical protein
MKQLSCRVDPLARIAFGGVAVFFVVVALFAARSWFDRDQTWTATACLLFGVVAVLWAMRAAGMSVTVEDNAVVVRNILWTRRIRRDEIERFGVGRAAWPASSIFRDTLVVELKTGSSVGPELFALRLSRLDAEAATELNGWLERGEQG